MGGGQRQATEAGLRREMVAVGRRMYERGMVTSIAGNVSVRMGDRVLITPTGSALDDMDPADLIVTDLKGTVLEGSGRPSSELPMHLAVYRANPQISAIVHTHSPVATAFSVVGRGLPAVTTEAEMLLGDVPLVPYAPPGSEELGRAVGEMAGRYHVVLLERHGLVAWADSLIAAFQRAELAEETARVHLFIRQIGGSA